MKPRYVVHYTVFPRYSGTFKSMYRFFETKEQLDKWLGFNPWIRENAIIFENIERKGD